MSPTQLTDIVHRILRRISYGEQVRPVRDWLLVLSVLGVLLIGMVSWSCWIFYQVSTNEAALPGAASHNGVNAATIEAVRTVFDMRAAERAHYQSDYRFVDPSR